MSTAAWSEAHATVHYYAELYEKARAAAVKCADMMDEAGGDDGGVLWLAAITEARALSAVTVTPPGDCIMCGFLESMRLPDWRSAGHE